MADGLWQQHRVQIQGYIDAHKRNVLEDLAVGNLTVIAAHHEPDYDTITVRVLAACADYDVDDEHGRVIRGDKRVGQVDGGLDVPAVRHGHHPRRRRHPVGQVPQLRGAARPGPGRGVQVLPGARSAPAPTTGCWPGSPKFRSA